MNPHKPLTRLPTHEVVNVPPLQEDQDLWSDDLPLREAVQREGAGWAAERLAGFGRRCGASETFELADQANRHVPQLRAFDRHGRRLNQVEYHPAYHELMDLAITNQLPSLAWAEPRPGAQVAHAALNYLLNQPEGGVLCPMAMTSSAIPSLRMTPQVGDEWIPRLLSTTYDRRDLPPELKTGATMGMFMTEKQGGSDVRSNSTVAVASGPGRGPGAVYRLTGHKHFCSAPMCDAFLTLAKTDDGLSCFLVPRWTPDGERNTLLIQRLKDKLGNRSNASSEMELFDTYGVMVGDEGRGVTTIIEMVQGNRYYCCFGSSALMRQALVQAMHHVRHRAAFGSLLIDKPLMRNVIADLAIESEAAITLTLRIGRAIDEAAQDPAAAALARIGTAIGKYWICKRASAHVGEAMECLGGPGYVEETLLPRLYREAPVNSIWEGSANVICLDVLRAMRRDELAVPALLAEIERAAGAHPELDRLLVTLKNEIADPADLELRARRITEMMATGLQGSLLARFAPSAVSDAFCATRLGFRLGGAYGTLPPGLDLAAIIDRALPA
ncbi:MAG: acyl-CoA dehydrogenase family protein [Burkholderiaceae bacterium]